MGPAIVFAYHGRQLPGHSAGRETQAEPSRIPELRTQSQEPGEATGVRVPREDKQRGDSYPRESSRDLQSNLQCCSPHACGEAAKAEGKKQQKGTSRTILRAHTG